MKIVFMGTPDFAVAALDALCEAGRDVVLVVTQPDRQKGRGRKVIKTPVKECAERRGIPVFQPVRVREPEAIERIRSLAPDLIVVAAFGQILPQELLDIPRLGCVNIHASLLPRLRGAAPIQWAVIEGHGETGITLMQMDAGLDTGDILFQESVPIGPQETGESLYGKLAALGGEMIVRCLPAIEAGQIHPVAQREEDSSYAPVLKKEMGEIDWSLPAEKICRRIRGMLPWPGAFTSLEGRVLKVWRADCADTLPAAAACTDTMSAAAHAETRPDAAPMDAMSAAVPADTPPAAVSADTLYDSADGAKPGTVLALGKDAMFVRSGDGIVSLLEVQAEGKRRMDTGAFLRGTRIKAGTVLGE